MEDLTSQVNQLVILLGIAGGALLTLLGVAVKGYGMIRAARREQDLLDARAKAAEARELQGQAVTYGVVASVDEALAALPPAQADLVRERMRSAQATKRLGAVQPEVARVLDVVRGLTPPPPGSAPPPLPPLPTPTLPVPPSPEPPAPG